jgi:hypothetical protein
MKKTVSLLFNSQTHCNQSIVDWIKAQKLSNVAVITDEKNTLSAAAFPYPLFSVATLIPTISETEEWIYRFHHHYRKFFVKQCSVYFKNINLLDDELRGYPFEMTARYMAAYLTIHKKYDQVIFVLSEHRMDCMIRLSAMLKTLQKMGITQQENMAIFNAKKQVFERVKLGFYRYYVWEFFSRDRSRLKHPHPQPLSRSVSEGRGVGVKHIPLPSPTPAFAGACFGRGVGGEGLSALNINYLFKTPRKQKGTLRKEKKHVPKPCLIITNAAPLHRNNFNPVYRKLCERLGKKPLAIACTQKAAQNAQEDGIAFTPLNQFFIVLRSPKFLIAALLTVLQYVFVKPFYLYKFSVLAAKKQREILRRCAPLDDSEGDPSSQDDSGCRRSFVASLLWMTTKTRIFKYDRHIQKHLFFEQMKVLFCKQGLLSRLLLNLIKTEQIERLLIQHQPTIIYKDVARSHFDGRIAQLAKKYHIPVATSIVASISNKYRNFGIYPCDFITLLGETQKIILKKRGYTDTQLICVGQPELDEAHLWNLSISSHYLSNLIPHFQPTIFTMLIATSYVDLPNEKTWITAICEYAKQQTRPMHIFLKPHPSAFNIYETWHHLPCLTLLAKSTPLYPCLTVADLVITDLSHAGKLAIFFNKPLITVNFSGKKFPFNQFDEENVAWLARSKQEIYQLLDEIQQGKLSIKQEAYHTYVRQHFTDNDGSACARIVDFLLHPHSS